MLTRRAFLAGRGRSPSPHAALFAARGREAEAAGGAPVDDAGTIRIHSNENPVGPGEEVVRRMLEAFGDAGRYPTNASPSTDDLTAAIARKLSVRPENVVVGNGSSELLRVAVRVYGSSSRHVITASPSFEMPETTAAQLGVPVTRVPVDAAGWIDLEAMAAAARWGGLVFLCNPNNPTATVHSRAKVADFVMRVRRESPETAVLIDEAYHDYVADPEYGTSIGLALEQPGVIVTRTMSKVYGLAGLRVGYAVAQPRTAELLKRWTMIYSTSGLSQAAAIAALEDDAHVEAEQARNAEVRTFTRRFFDGIGIRTTESQANFVFAEIGRPATEFEAACLREGVRVGRPFPPLDQRWARVSLGTMDEMQRATRVFARVLSGQASTGSAPQRRVAG